MFFIVSLKKVEAYDQHNDQFLPVRDSVNVLLMRGIFRQFKIPIWYKFAKKPSKDDLLHIIKEVEECGFHVASVTCDSASDNQGLANDLKITKENPFFKNPCRDDNVYWFFDPGSDQL